METVAIGNALVALCREGKNEEAINQFYSDDIVSIEGAAGPEMPQRMEGIEAIRGKNQWWYENHEVHGMEIEGPFAAEGSDQFSVRWGIDVTFKPSGERSQMTEIATYTVKDGKIAEERFYYLMAG